MKTGFSVFLLLGLLLGPTALIAQSLDDEHTRIVPSGELAQPDGTDARPRVADTLVAEPSKGLIRRIFDYFDSSNVDRTFEKKIDWSIAPGPNYSSDVGFGIGFLLAGLYRPDRTDSVTAPSNISIYGNFTTQKFVLLRFSGDNILDQNKQRVSYTGAFVYFPGAFYGIGYNAGKAGYVQKLTTTMGIARVSYCRAIAGRLYAGVSAGVDYTGAKYKDSGIAATLKKIENNEIENPGGSVGELYDLWQEGRYDPSLQDPFTNFIATSGDNPDAFNTNIGLFLQYDSRDVTYNATRGVFVKTEAMWYPEFLGNTHRDFGRIALTFDAYRKLWKGAVLAYDLYADFIIGTPSWHLYAKLGGMSRMRGYYEGRYRDKRLVETQAELRQKIYRRHGVSGWFGVGQVWGTDKFQWKNTLYSFGVGYRFEFKKGMNIRLDYGWGVHGNKELPWDRKRSSAFLFTASEAF
ncbi:MAG: BamA/TamA family outer membrane protein [Alistipes sp.]|nr:BamA/TamA family outer membrane protein [Alistipes sp.]